MRVPGQPYHLKKVTHKEVKALIRNLNVQIENLCQFLPQGEGGREGEERERERGKGMVVFVDFVSCYLCLFFFLLDRVGAFASMDEKNLLHEVHFFLLFLFVAFFHHSNFHYLFSFLFFLIIFFFLIDIESCWWG